MAQQQQQPASTPTWLRVTKVLLWLGALYLAMGAACAGVHCYFARFMK